MMTEINGDQARALAALVAALRPEWDLPGIRKALWEARTRGTPWDVAHAALYAAQDPKNRTPAVIPMIGTHWVASKPLGEAGAIRYPRCEEPGHQSFAAYNCSACRSEQLERTSEPVHQANRTPSVPPERVREILESTTSKSTGRDLHWARDRTRATERLSMR